LIFLAKPDRDRRILIRNARIILSVQDRSLEGGPAP